MAEILSDTIKIGIEADLNKKSFEEAGKKAGKVINEALSKSTNIDESAISKIGDRIGNNVAKSASGAIKNYIRQTPKYTSNKYLGKAFEQAMGINNKFKPTQEMVEALFAPKYADVSKLKARLKSKYRKSTRQEIIDTFNSAPMPILGRGGIGRDYVGETTDYGKIVSDAAIRNSYSRQKIADRVSKQSMYESLWASLDNGGTVFGRNNVVNKDYIGMGIDIIGSKMKNLMPVIDKIKESLKPIKTFLGRLGRIAIYRAIRTILKEISQALKEGVNNLYQWSKLQTSTFGNSFAKSLDKISTSLLTIKNSIATVVEPIINTLAPAIETISVKFQQASESMAQFFATLFGTGHYLKAIKNNIAYADSVNAIKNSLMGFDELNVLNGKSSGSAISDYSNLFETITLSDELEKDIALKMIDIGAKVSAVPLALGAILALTGVNIPLGIGLMALGAVGLAQTVKTTWNALDEDMQKALGSIFTIVSAGSLALGAILAFTGANIPLGVGLMAAGAIGLVTVAKLDWDSTSDKVKEAISKVTVVTSSLLLGVGLLLAFTGNIPLGLGMILAGGAGLATAAVINWDAIKEKLQEAWNSIKTWFNTNVAPKLSFSYWEEKGRTLVKGFLTGIQNYFTSEGRTNSLQKYLNSAGDTSGLFDIAPDLVTSTTTSNIKDEDWWKKYYGYANGGTPDTGSLFLAGEAGPELVTQIGGRSTVYNEEQLGSSLAYANEGVISAINTLIGVVRSKSNNVTISASDIRKAVNSSSMRVGV